METPFSFTRQGRTAFALSGSGPGSGRAWRKKCRLRSHRLRANNSGHDRRTHDFDLVVGSLRRPRPVMRDCNEQPPETFEAAFSYSGRTQDRAEQESRQW